jgi:hypothetical protein
LFIFWSDASRGDPASARVNNKPIKLNPLQLIRLFLPTIQIPLFGLSDLFSSLLPFSFLDYFGVELPLTMLRRAPTTITLTAADVQQYEENRERRILEARQQQAAAQAYQEANKGKGANDSSKTSKEKSKKDRIMGGGR